ncbi:MAG: ABC transporter permease [Actinobacteria bacterium]|nr:ABC transporter permease [Actinomycetota bacterium]
MFKRVIFKSLFNRKRQLIVATLAILLAATLIAALANLSQGMKIQLSREFEAYGPNIILVPIGVTMPAGAGQLVFGEILTENYISEQNLSPLNTILAEDVKVYVPYIYNIATHQDQKVVVVGTLFDKLRELAPYWQIEGQWVKNKNAKEAILGIKVARKFAIQPGDDFSLKFGTLSQNFKVSGIAEIGGSEDNQIFIDLKTAQSLSGRSEQIDLVQIRASGEKRPVSETATRLSETITGAETKIIGQIAGAEQKVLFKIELLIAIITVLVLVGSAVAVFSTLTASVLDRRREIGLMKALGATNHWIAIIFLAETWSISLAGGLTGNILGWGMAQIIAKNVFSAYLSLQIWVIPVTVFAVLAVSTVAALGPIRGAVSLEPIITLRGE